MNARDPLSVAVLISGRGATLKNLLDRIAMGKLPVAVKLVISSRGDAAGLQYARDAGIAHLVVPKRKFGNDADAHSQAVFDPCREAGVAAVVMGGFVEHVLIPEDFENRVLNIHPSLIPAFCGHGFYGGRVHEEVLRQGAKISGCTVHFVDNEYDHGPIILQRAVDVADDDTPESLAARIFQAECEAYPDALRLLAANRLRVENGRVRVLPAADN